MYLPTQLPYIDTIEVFVLGERLSDSYGKFFAIKFPTTSGDRYGKFLVSSSTRVTGELADKIAKLWRHLPAGQQARCHLPPLGLQFFANQSLILEASICWQCNNIWITMNGETLVYEFDVDHHISQELFATLSKITNLQEAPKLGLFHSIKNAIYRLLM